MNKLNKTTVIYAAAFSMALTINAFGFALVFYSKEKFLASPTQVGILIACHNISYVLSCLGLNRLIRRLATRWSLILATGLLLVGSWLTYNASYLPQAFIGQCCCGMGTAFFWPPLMGWLSTGLEGQALNRATGFYNLSWSTGSILSPLLAGFLCSRQASYPLFLSIIAYLLAFIFFVTHRNHPVLRQRDESSSLRSKSLSAGQSSILRFPAWLGVGAAWVGIGMILTIYPLAAEEILGLNREKIGLLLLLRALATTAAMSLMGFIRSWHFQPRQLLAGQIVMCLAMLGLGLSKNILLAAFCLIISGFMGGHAYTNSLFHGVSGSSDRTLRTAIHEVLLASGYVTGAILGGRIYQMHGLFWTCVLTSAIMAIPIIATVNWWIPAMQETTRKI